MRKFLTVIATLLLIAPVFALDVGDEPAVSVRVAELKTGLGFLAQSVTQLDYGESVVITELRGDWVKVRVTATGDEGWLHVTAVARKSDLRLDLSDDPSATATSSREIALAGRGFNEQVEARYRSEKGLDFSVVDEMEDFGQPNHDLAACLDDGGLNVGDGGAE